MAATYKAWIRQKLPNCRPSTGGYSDTHGYAGIHVSHSIPFFSELKIRERNQDTADSGHGGTREPASPRRSLGLRLLPLPFPPSPALPLTKNIHPAERKMARRSTTRKKEEDISGGAVFSSALCSSQAAGGNEKRMARGAD